jgi:NAD(P)-dependent dehydrogenase (short-subunit alcohol dehydrogenase family)
MARPVIVITGASQGIGAEIARIFASEVRGARLALVARGAARLRTVARSCAARGAVAEAFPCDVADEDAVAAMAKAVLKRFGRVDVVINNAGRFLAAPLEKMTVADFDGIVAANLRSVFLVSRAFIPGMLRRRRGDILNMSSVAGLAVFPGDSAYAAAKAGVTMLSRVMRAELSGRGIRVCCVHPGATWSPSWSGTRVSRSRLMPASDVARAFLDAWRLGRRTVVEEIVLRPQLGDL